MIKIIAHDTTMEIPIFNSIYADKNKIIKTNEINIQKLNNLNFKKIDYRKFPTVKLLNSLPQKDSLFETALVSVNDRLVNLFLEGKIKYNDLNEKMSKILNTMEIKKLKKKLPSTISKVINTHEFINFKLSSYK